MIDPAVSERSATPPSKTSSLASSSEDRLIAWLRERLPKPDLLGDDAALLPASGPYAATVDSQIEGVHFPEGR